MDGSVVFETADPVRRLLLRAAIERAYEIRLDLHDDQAVKTVNRLVEAMPE